ncbi:OLC1v1017364C2 [Oldenlandia corymbosa var. corymbosa]|nr:OLC1v1017364C2 [Oldenlandia corymbosa var. corymbosa]
MCEGKEMEGADSRPWDDLLPDALGLIFKNLSLREKLTVIPVVCKSWSKVVTGPYCWQEIDIEGWSHGTDPYGNAPAKVDKMLRVLITRSSGSLRTLCVSGLKLESTFQFILEHVHSLQTLKLPRSAISDSLMESNAQKLSTLTYLDLSYCSKIGAGAMEAIGKNCKSLARLSRNMHPLDVEGKLSQNDEAHAIATTMPKLKHLEMAYHLVDTKGVLDIINSCPDLEFLDLRGCWEVKLDEQYLKETSPNLTVLGPQVVDHYEEISWECCSDYSDSLYDYDSDMIWDDEDRLEMRFYAGSSEETAYGWPPSP